MNQLFSKLPKVVLSVLFAAFAGSAVAGSDNPGLSEPTVEVGGTYVKISGTLTDVGSLSKTADITLAVAKTDEEFDEPVVVKTGVHAGDSFVRVVSGLRLDTDYKFRLTATNEHGGSTTVEGTFTTAGGSGTTPGVMTVTASGYTGGTTLEGFPLLVRLSAEKLAVLGVKGWPEEAESVVFYDADENELPCEVDTWDPQGEMLFWVRVPSLVGTTTQITLKWGKGVERHLPATDVWTDYALVHHLDDAPVTTEFDSTGNGFKAQPSVAAADCALAEGVVGQSYYKNGGSLQVDDYSSLALGGTFTATGWFYLDQRTAYESFFAKKSEWNSGDGWSSNMQNNDKQLFYTGSGSKTAADINLSKDVKGRWMHMTYVYDDTTLRFYENGGTATVATKSINAAKDNTLVLMVAGGVKGRTDEVRVRKGAVSSDWVLADYATQHDADFCSFALVTNPQSDYGEDPVVDWNGQISVDRSATISLPYDAPWGGDAAALVDVHAVWGFAEDALDHDVIVAAGTLGAGVGLLEDAKPGETYFVKLYAQSGEKTSERTTVRSVRIPSASAVGDSRSESTRNSYTVSGAVTPGVGLTRVWLRYSFNSDELDQSVFVCEKQIGDDPSFVYAFEPTQFGDTLHWQVVVSNDYASATWGDFAWGDKTESAAQILTDTETVDWTWQTAGAGDWQEAGNWSAKDRAGFPNTAGAQALFTTAADGATATLQDDVTLKLLKATGAKATVDANGHLLTTAGITLALGPNGETPELTLANAAFGANVKPTFPASEGTGGQAKLIYRNSTATLAVGDWAQPAHSALVADGGSLYVSGNYSRWAAGGNLPDRLVAALNGARVTLEAFSHLGSSDHEQPHVLVATEGARLAAGGGLNRTFLHANILVAVTNATFGMGAGNNRYAMGFADDSHFDLNGATLDCYWILGHRSSAYVTGDCTFAGFGPQLMSNYSWNNTEDTARKGVFSSVDSEILVENARVTGANRLSYVYGTNSTIRIRDSVVAMNGQLNFAPNFGCGSQFIVDNSIVTNAAHWLDFDVQTNVLGSALVLCGEAPRYVITGNGSDVSCELGTDAEQTNPAEIRFVLPREGFVEAPIQFRAKKNGRIRAHLPIRIDATGYRKLRRYTMPLISMDQGWGVKATAEDITANLPAGALPKGAKLVWVGNDLCLEMPSQGGLMLIVR